MKKQMNVVMLATKKASNLYHSMIDNENKLHLSVKQVGKDKYGRTPQHIYITDDSEIKEGDWYIDFSVKEDGRLHKCRTTPSQDLNNGSCKKVIATTNPELWFEPKIDVNGNTLAVRSSIAKLSQDFIQALILEYNAGKPITKVDVEIGPAYDCCGAIMQGSSCADRNHCKLVPKLRTDGTIITHPIIEQMFTIDEAIKIFEDGRNSANYQVTDIIKFIQDKYK